MTSLLLDKLEILRSHERKNKENQRVLQEQIEFEIEMQRRLEMDATIVKLQTQLSIFSRNTDLNNVHTMSKEYRDIEYMKIKIYNDIIPMFTTMIGIMKKQQEQINQF
jgi:hypothetical protein